MKTTHTMRKIKKRLQKEGVLPPADLTRQGIFFEGREIGDEQRCMDISLPEFATVYLNPVKFDVPVRKPDGEIFSLQIDESICIPI